MSNPPNSVWPMVSFGKIARKLVNGGTPPTEVEAFWNGKTPWITGADFTPTGISEFRRFVSDAAIAQTSTNVIERGQLLLVTRTGVGKLAIAPCDIAISQDITGVYVDEERADTHFLFHRMRRGVEDLKKLNQGTSINGIIRSDLIAYPLELPPLPTQRRIAEILSTVDEAIEQTEALIAKYQQIKAGLMHDLFTRGLTPDGHLRPTYAQASHLYKESPLGWIPKEWEVVRIAEAFEIQLGKMLNKFAKTGKLSAPYLGNRAVQWDFVDISAIEVMDFNAYERLKFSLLSGDLLVCEGGDVGRTAMWRGEMEGCYYQKAIHRLRPRSDDALPAFMLRFMRFARDSGYFREFTSQSSIAHLTQEKLGSINMLRPSKKEQGWIADRFDSVDEFLQVEQSRLANLRQQKHGLMHDLLTGHVRVKVAEAASA